MKSGAKLISEERKEQIKKHNWSPAHDSNHRYGELRKVAATLCVFDTDARVEDPGGYGTDEDPWNLESKLKNDIIHRLKVAGALIAAEIDRLQSNPENSSFITH
jgi:hypothetical protein